MDVKDLDVIVVPLLMFDANHNRIGYGRGFYDRCLKKTNALTIGFVRAFLVFSENKLRQIRVKRRF